MIAEIYYVKVHGILNIVGWGTILPIGVILSRYLKRFPYRYKYWFRLHASTQCVGYVLGVSGWIIGLVLGHASSQHTFRTHRILGICIFTFTTIQVKYLFLDLPTNLINFCNPTNVLEIYLDSIGENKQDNLTNSLTMFSDVCIAIKAQYAGRVQGILEHVPSSSWLLSAGHNRNQHFSRICHLEATLS